MAKLVQRLRGLHFVVRWNVGTSSPFSPPPRRLKGANGPPETIPPSVNGLNRSNLKNEPDAGALPVIFTASLSNGSKELAKRGVLVTPLSAAEDAATIDVLGVDKTGAITRNQLAVTGVIPLGQAPASRTAVQFYPASGDPDGGPKQASSASLVSILFSVFSTSWARGADVTYNRRGKLMEGCHDD